MTEDSSVALIRDSVAAIAPKNGDLARVRRLRFTAPGFDRATWSRIAELGWIGLRVPEARGGAGLGVAALCAVAQELGAGLVPEPFVPCAAVAPLLPDDVLARALAGAALVVPAWQEHVRDLDLGSATTASKATASTAAPSRGRVDGRKLFVPAADVASAFLVTTTNGLALVAREQPGVTVATIATQDGGFLGDVRFEGAEATMLPGRFADAFDDAALATAAYLFGATERMFGMTLEYLRTRRQFGRPIGTFQALQHRAADLKIQLELARAVLAEAIGVVDGTAAADVKSAAVSRAKARASDAAMQMAREATQFHGAIGITDELDLSLYTRKVLTLYNAFGASAAHRARYAMLSLA